MKIRYRQGSDGFSAVAKVYGPGEHGIDISRIDKDAANVVSRLNSNGYEAYIVGGAVRDLMLGKIPKDFDVATSASPRQVHKVFHNSRIIGRRFRIVHVAFGQKIIEVSTFRSIREHSQGRDNCFGTIEEDASRRDFSINSLYFNPDDNTVIDFNNSLEDFRRHRITSLIPLDRTFDEDPVRMLRAVKYSVTTGFRLRRGIAVAIRLNAPLLQTVSTSRLTEELNKILSSGFSAPIIEKLRKFRLLVYVLPCYSVHVPNEKLRHSLEELDRKVMLHRTDAKTPEVPGAMQYLALCSPLLIIPDSGFSPAEAASDLLRQMKILISPNTPPNHELEEAVRKFMILNSLEIPRPPKKPVSRRSPSSRRARVRPIPGFRH